MRIAIGGITHEANTFCPHITDLDDFKARQMLRGDEILDKWIPAYETEDRPAKLIDQLKWLEAIGFHSVDVVWKYYNFCVYGGMK